MATKPTPGASDGTYGTEMNVFLDVSLDVNGKIATEALQTDSTAPVADAAVANKLYVDNGGEREVNGTPTVVHTKYFTGTSTAGVTTTKAHGIASGLTKILHVSGAITATSGVTYLVSDYGDDDAAATRGFGIQFDGTNVYFTNVQTNQQGKAYIFKIDYID